MLRRVLNALGLLALALLAAACRVDLVVDVTMEDDGSGLVRVTATADSEVVASAPGLAQDLRFDDLTAAGWEVTGPSMTDDGALTVTLARAFVTPQEAGAILSSLNGADGPFQRVEIERAESDSVLTFTVSGVGRTNSGVAVFTDPQLLAAVGATPYVDEIAEAGLSPAEAIGIALRVELPGTVEESSIDPESEADGLAWTIPVDGSSVQMSATSTVSLERDRAWSVVATVLLVALIAWVVVSAAFIAFVVRARRRRQRRLRAHDEPRAVTPTA